MKSFSLAIIVFFTFSFLSLAAPKKGGTFIIRLGSQPPTIQRLLPIEPPSQESNDDRDVIFEPTPEEILEQLERSDKNNIKFR